MSTVRQRAVELATSPDAMSQSPQKFETPGEAKLEADAYLALCASQIVGELVSSEEREQSFMETFNILAVRKFSEGVPNSSIEPEAAYEVFDDSMIEVYRDHDLINKVIEGTDLGKRTAEAATYYVEACDASDYRPTRMFGGPINYRDYEQPASMLSRGLGTFMGVYGQIIKWTNNLVPSPDRRAEKLRGSATGLQKLASLSIHQVGSPVSSKGRLKRNGFDIASNIEELRSFPAHKDLNDAMIRPHHGCPALPVLPETPLSHSGSAIKNLWLITAELAIATNMHALDSDEEQYRLVPRAQAADEELAA